MVLSHARMLSYAFIARPHALQCDLALLAKQLSTKPPSLAQLSLLRSALCNLFLESLAGEVQDTGLKHTVHYK
eukprot:7354063-Lingulodinium_polyedra.AAC.1